jgi:hypothetical protein
LTLLFGLGDFQIFDSNTLARFLRFSPNYFVIIGRVSVMLFFCEICTKFNALSLFLCQTHCGINFK